MRSAVEAWAEADAPSPVHGHSRYKPMCACCAPQEPSVQAGRPQRRALTRPVLAWRARLAALQAQDTALAGAEFDAKSVFEAVDSAGAATKIIVNEVKPC